MKNELRAYLIFFSVIALIGLTLFVVVQSPRYIWKAQSKHNLDVLILDKTVPTSSYREHKGLTWLLNYNHWQNAGRDYSVSDDYAGWRPKDKDRQWNTPQAVPIPPADKYDLIYLADTYGIYKDTPEAKGKKGTRAALVYGGLKQDEVDQITSQLRPGGTIVAEFNSFADPTTNEVRERMSKIVGVEWTGWIGRHIDDLDIKSVEIPTWMPGQYKQSHGDTWNFSGSGFVFVHNDGKIAVLRDKKDIQPDGLVVNFNKSMRDKYNVKNNIPYNYWFDVMTIRDKAKTIAGYQLLPTANGQKILDKAGIPNYFPAVVKTQSATRTTYYFAGDWIDKIDLPTHNHIWQIKLNQYHYYKDFYWNVYVPLMGQILKDTYSRV